MFLPEIARITQGRARDAQADQIFKAEPRKLKLKTKPP